MHHDSNNRILVLDSKNKELVWKYDTRANQNRITRVEIIRQLRREYPHYTPEDIARIAGHRTTSAQARMILELSGMPVEALTN